LSRGQQTEADVGTQLVPQGWVPAAQLSVQAPLEHAIPLEQSAPEQQPSATMQVFVPAQAL
jgi:hypothetical protein